MASTSDEVAADFEDSLKDLQINNRYEISNLTIIAKENTEHAQAISEVLEKHIRKVLILFLCILLRYSLQVLAHMASFILSI